MSHYYADILREIFSPTKEQIERRKEAERKRRSQLTILEIVGETMESVFWFMISLTAISVLVGPWLIGAVTIVLTIVHWVVH